MHIEKNIYDKIIDTVLNILKKIKNGTKAHLDLQEMGIQLEMHLVRRGERFFMSPTCYLLFEEKKKNFCGWFKTVSFLMHILQMYDNVLETITVISLA